MNSQKIAEAEEFIEQKNYQLAANHLKKQAEYLKSIGKDDIRDQILTKALDILLDGVEFENFFTHFNELSGVMRKKYLTRIFPKFLYYQVNAEWFVDTVVARSTGVAMRTRSASA